MAATRGFHFQEGTSTFSNKRPSTYILGSEKRRLNEWNQLESRTPIHIREQLINLFRSPLNIAYLRTLFTQTIPPGPLQCFALETLEDSIYSFERLEDLIYSDPIARRGDSHRATNLWDELRRFNRAFYEYRMQFLRDKTALISGHTEDNDEQYHYRMFIADSLHPPGLEHLNGTKPFHVMEDQNASHDDSIGYSRREDFSSTGTSRISTNMALPPQNPGIDPNDWGWDGGNPNRTHEQALAEYWGDNHTESSTVVNGDGEAYIDHYGQGARWRKNNGTRFMRYPTIPIWQNLSRGRNYDQEIEETLGTGGREFDNHIRRWDMNLARKI